jgi:hypothetical protein
MKNVDDAIDNLDINFNKEKRWQSKRRLNLFTKSCCLRWLIHLINIKNCI